MLQERQGIYLEQMLSATFDFTPIIQQIEHLQKYTAEKMEFEDPKMRDAMGFILNRIRGEEKNTATFRRQLQNLLRQNLTEELLERVARGSEYDCAFMEANLRLLLVHLAEVERLTRTKTYRNALSEIDQQVMLSIGKMKEAEHISACIISGLKIHKADSTSRALTERRTGLWEEAQKAADANPKLGKRKSGRKRKKGAKTEKGETIRLTYALIKEGKSMKEIASRTKPGPLHHRNPCPQGHQGRPA